MSKPGVIYRLKWDTVPVIKPGIQVASQVVTVNIYNTETLIDDSADEVVYDLQPAANPLVIQSIDNDEDKFTPVRAKQARIKFLSNSAVDQDADFFFDSSDTRWKVVISVPFATIFIGFLVIPDIQQPFLPDPNEVEIIATDMLGSLSNQDLQDFTGINPLGKYKIGEFIAMALKPTGLDLPIYVVNNVRYYSGGTDGHLYDKIYLDAKTFEASIGESEKCRTVLEKILGEDCVLFQWKGAWWIMRIDEIDDNLFYVAQFGTDGLFVGFITSINPTKPIGASTTIGHSDIGTTLRSDRRHKHIKLTYRYENPTELICNSDFSRGDFIADMPDETEDSITYQVKKYEIECWDYAVHKSNGNPSDTPIGEAYIKRLFFNDSELQRYIEITGDPPPGEFHEASIKSQPLPVQKQDKINISLSSRWDVNFDDGTVTTTMGVELVGDDGTYWYLHDSGLWFPYPPGIGDIVFISNPALPDTNYTQWQDFSYNSKPIPVSGNLYIYLSQNPNEDTTKINHTSFDFEIIAFINGSYTKYKGQSTKVTNLDTTGLITTREKDIYISDSPRKTFKGALLYPDGPDYILANQFYTANTFALGTPPSIDYVHPFGHIQAYAVWNQYRNACRIFPSTLYGYFLNTMPNEWPDLVHKYQLADTNPNTDNRYFLLISPEQDWKTCRWRGTFIESYNRTIGHRYEDTKEFRYITS